jgi:hypothetical protein
MKLPSGFTIAAFVLAGLCQAATAQDPPAAVKERLIDFKDIKIQVQKTPDFSLKGGTKDKRVSPKDWIEIEPEFKTLRSPSDKKAEVIPELTFKYYVYLNGSVKDNARILTAEVIHTNVPIDEVLHSVVYISPSAILRVTGKPEGNVGLVSAYGVEVSKGGEIVGFYSQLGATKMNNPNDAKAKWWEAKSAPQMEPALLSKPQTPFAPLWGDFHADVKAK